MNTAPSKLVVISLMTLQLAFFIGIAFAFGLEENLAFHEVTHQNSSAQVLGASDEIIDIAPATNENSLEEENISPNTTQIEFINQGDIVLEE